MVSLFSGSSGPVGAPLRRHRGDKLLSFTASSRRNGARAARCAAPTVLQGHIGIPERAVLDPPLRRIRSRPHSSGNRIPPPLRGTPL